MTKDGKKRLHPFAGMTRIRFEGSSRRKRSFPVDFSAPSRRSPWKLVSNPGLAQLAGESAYAEAVIHFDRSLFEPAPTLVAASFPSLKIINVGIERMPYCAAIS